MNPPRILFVDDEPDVLGGLRRALWKRRTEWDLRWADSGESALQHLQGGDIDILVTDMRMPGIDGVELLSRARELSPSTVRFVLSGQADQAAILAATGQTQQFLSKPCDPQHLDHVLSRAVASLASLRRSAVGAAISGSSSLPRMPATCAELMRVAREGGATVAELAGIVERDVATAAEVLRIVNSAFFGIATEVTTIQRAVSMLGLDILCGVVLSGSLFSDKDRLPPGLDSGRIMTGGLAAACGVRAIGTLEGWDSAEIGRLSMAAMLYDVGLVVMAVANPRAWAEYLAIAEVDDRSREVAAFTCTIGEASAYLLSLWGFPPEVSEALEQQPIDLADLAAGTPAALAIAVGRHVITSGRSGLPFPAGRDGEYWNAERARRWEAALPSESS